ncbi:MAG: hypothetical protein GC152_06780 [Alphaproteobacteria bacterium]|nr:hypothetical protein [Alphaproteobacteria bacterium]
MSSPPRKHLTGFLALYGALAVCLLGTAGLVWAVDPLQVFRRASFYEPIIESDERTQNAGLLRSYPAQGLLIGSSLSQACRADDFTKALGTDFLRISAAGMTAKEWRYFLETRIMRRKPARVVDIQYWFTFGRTNAMDFREEYGAFPTHLYQPGALDIAKYLINYDNIGMAINVLAEAAGFSAIERIDFQSRNSPEADPRRTTGVASVRRLYNQIAGGRKPDAAFLAAERNRMLAAFDEFYAPFILDHQEIQFDIVVPPFTLAYYQAFKSAGVYRLNTILLFRQKLAELAREAPNVRIHDFGVDDRFLSDYDNFYDTHHFSATICARIADDIAAKPAGDGAEAVIEGTQRLKALVDDAELPW